MIVGGVLLISWWKEQVVGFKVQAVQIVQAVKPSDHRFERLERFELLECLFPAFLAQAGEKMGEIEDIGVGHWIHHVRHRGIVAASRIALILAQRFDEIVLALAGQARNVLFPRKILVMAEIAPVLLDQYTRPLDAGRIWRRRRRAAVAAAWRCSSAMRRTSSSLRPLVSCVHRLDDAHPFAEHVELDRDIERRLSAERRHLGDCRLPLLTMTGEAGSEPLLKCRRCNR